MEEVNEGEKKEETFEDFQRLAEELTGEPQTEENIKAQQAKDRNLADAEELISYALTKKKLELPTVGAFVEYMPLRTQERIEINSIHDENEDIQRDLRNRKTVYLLLNRADKRYTEDAIDNLPASIIDAILLEYEMAENAPFLLPILNRRRDGFRQTLRRRG